MIQSLSKTLAVFIMPVRSYEPVRGLEEMLTDKDNQ